MYGKYYSGDGYCFDNEESRNAYEFYSRDEAFVFASSYGGYKEDYKEQNSYKEDEDNYSQSIRTSYSKPKKYRIIHETEKALLLESKKGRRFWTPKSKTSYSVIDKEFLKCSFPDYFTKKYINDENNIPRE